MSGTLSFLANEVVSNEGGALYIQEFAQVKLLPGAEIEFINNTGRCVIKNSLFMSVTASVPFPELVLPLWLMSRDRLLSSPSLSSTLSAS